MVWPVPHCVLFAIVDEVVRRAGGDRDRLARTEPLLPTIHGEAQRARDYLGSALLAGVDVLRLLYAGRRVDGFDLQERPVRIGARLEEAHALAGARIADLLFGSSHYCSLIG